MKFSYKCKQTCDRLKFAELFDFQVTWLKDNQLVEINRNGRLILSNENSLLIAQIKKTDAGNYTCIASNIAGTYSSEPAELIVHGREKSLKILFEDTPSSFCV